MKANELRIGNYIDANMAYNADTITYFQDSKVLEIGDFYVKLQRRLIPYEYVMAIPLTQKWLVKFGFDKRIMKIDRNGGEDWFDITRVLVNDDVDNPEWGYLFTMNGESIIVVKHVHELQNLYFELVGEELPIKS